ncbi:uncharacterized protein C20orf144 homolog [Sarcophilus harrisii]|uniref:Uncharacterized protein n=1 Tax=Sarcophilus harrisii TaxID=9305 RepID=A0A7N4P5T0_SARHA|nr:uncharacterized protein C20orf144 homolog [Sarcophilus harrisii]
MGNYNSHKKTKVPKKKLKKKPPDKEKAKKKPFFGRSKSPKIVLLLPLNKRNQLAETTVPLRSQWAGRPQDEAGAAPADCSLKGAGDGTGPRADSRAREMKKILVFLLLLDARLQDEWWKADSGSKSAQAWQHLHSRLLAENEAEDQPQPQKRWHQARCQN